MHSLRTDARITVLLALWVFTLASVAFCQEPVNSTHPDGKKDGSLKLADTTRILKRQGTASGVGANKVRTDWSGQESHSSTPRTYGEPGKNIVESASQSSGESHKSQGSSVETNIASSDRSILNLNNSVDKDNNGIPDGWNSNTTAAIQFARIVDGSHQLTITCQDKPVYILKYFEVNAGTEYEIFLTYSGQESDLTVKEFSANNQPIVDGIQQTLLARATGEQFAMKFRTSNETRRMFFKIEVSSTGTLLLHKLVFQPVEILRRDGQ